MAGCLKAACCKSPEPAHCDQVSTTCNKTAMFPADAMILYMIAHINQEGLHIQTPPPATCSAVGPLRETKTDCTVCMIVVELTVMAQAFVFSLGHCVL